jgi:hypothetical protein
VVQSVQAEAQHSAVQAMPQPPLFEGSLVVSEQ